MGLRKYHRRVKGPLLKKKKCSINPLNVLSYEFHVFMFLMKRINRSYSKGFFFTFVQVVIGRTEWFLHVMCVFSCTSVAATGECKHICLINAHSGNMAAKGRASIQSAAEIYTPINFCLKVWDWKQAEKHAAIRQLCLISPPQTARLKRCSTFLSFINEMFFFTRQNDLGSEIYAFKRLF